MSPSVAVTQITWLMPLATCIMPSSNAWLWLRIKRTILVIHLANNQARIKGLMQKVLSHACWVMTQQNTALIHNSGKEYLQVTQCCILWEGFFWNPAVTILHHEACIFAGIINDHKITQYCKIPVVLLTSLISPKIGCTD